MRPGYICVAGITAKPHRHIRPVLSTGLDTSLLRRADGPFGIGCVIELGETMYTGRSPEVEDYRFKREQAYYLRNLNPAHYWSVLQRVAHSTLTDIFGDDLQQRSRSCVMNVGMGVASLGCLRPPKPPRLYVNGYGRIRMIINDNTYAADLSVTDLRLYETDHRTDLTPFSVPGAMRV